MSASWTKTRIRQTFVSLVGETFSLELPSQTGPDSFFVCAPHKADAALLFSLVQDLGVAAGRSVVDLAGQAFAQGISAADFSLEAWSLLETPGHIFTGSLPPSILSGVRRYRASRKVILVRDPYDIAASYDFAGQVFEDIRGFASHLRNFSNFRVIRYEDIIHEKEGFVADLAKELQINLPQTTLAEIAMRHAIAPGEKRAVSPGDYKKHLASDAYRHMERSFGPVVEAFGYQTTPATQQHGARAATSSTQIEPISSIESTLQHVLTTVLTRFAPAGLGQQFHRGLNAVGIMNWQDEWISGERRFLTLFSDRFPGARVFDVGANVGTYSKLVRTLSPASELHSFEPHPVAFQKLRAEPSLRDVHMHQMALGNSTGTVEIFDYPDQQGSGHASLYRDVIEKIHGAPAEGWSVPCATIDNFVRLNGVAKIGLLKIDTEGHELSVLQGAQDTMSRGLIDVIQFEFNSMNVISRTFFRDFFEILPGYTLYRLLPDGVLRLATYDPVFMEIFAFQNIVGIRNDLDQDWIQGSGPVKE